MSYLSDRKRTTTTTPTVFHEIGICGGTSSMATVRAKQIARQREIDSAATRKIRSEEYLKNYNDDEDREKKERARAYASLLEEQRVDHLTARADRLRLRTDSDTLSVYAERKPIEGSATSEVPYSVLKARRKEEQQRRQSNDRREQIDKDLARARALLDEERTRDNLEIAKDLAKGYGSTSRRSNLRDDFSDRRREAGSSILKLNNRKQLDLEDDWRSAARTRPTDEKLADSALGRINGSYREIGEPSSSARTSKTSATRLPKEVRWSLDD